MLGIIDVRYPHSESRAFDLEGKVIIAASFSTGGQLMPPGKEQLMVMSSAPGLAHPSPE